MVDCQVICILGMHRSGTSLITRLVNLLGVYLGPPEFLLEPKTDNPKGFWEYLPFVDINDQLLQQQGGNWYDLPDFSSGWECKPAFANLKSKAMDLIKRDFSSRSLWGWKDPRACITTPFWKQVIPRMRYILCFRNPIDVARSLESRQLLPPGRTFQVWLEYVEAALRNTDGEDRIVFSYEDLLNHTEHELVRLSSFLGATARLDGDKRAQSARSFVDKELHHHRTSTAETINNSSLPLGGRAVFVALRHLIDSLRVSDPSSPELRAAEGDVTLLCHRAVVEGRVARPPWLPGVLHRGIRSLLAKLSGRTD